MPIKQNAIANVSDVVNIIEVNDEKRNNVNVATCCPNYLLKISSQVPRREARTCGLNIKVVRT